MKKSELDYTEKTCSSCKTTKHLTEFHKNKRSSDGYQTVCKPCNLENTRSRHPDYWRRQNLRRNFGITLEQYEELLTKQDYCCALCGKHESEENKKLAVDHDHKTGRIRGLLCTHCNYRLIGKFRDADLLRRMADYVEGGTDWFVPKKKKPVKRKPKRI